MFHDTFFAFLKKLALELNLYLKPSRRRYHYKMTFFLKFGVTSDFGHVLGNIEIDILVSITYNSISFEMVGDNDLIQIWGCIRM